MSLLTRPLVALLVWLAAGALEASDLDRHMKAVEAIRGLSFTGPVNSVVIDRSELPGRLRDQFTRTLPYGIDEWEEMLRALLLIEPATEAPLNQLLDLYEAQVLAYYDPLTRTYYALRQPPSAFRNLPAGMAAEDGVIVHELMHALQDQRFDIGKRDLALRRNTDASLAYHALLEGEASLVMLAYLIELSGADFDTVVRQPLFDSLLGTSAAADLMLDPSTPRYFAESVKFPYLEGLRFVVTAYRRGGWAELDRIHADPPRSTREVLHPDDYFERRFRPRDYAGKPAAAPGATAVEHLGEFHWSFLVGAENARGWTGDRVTLVHDAFCDPTILVETSWESEEAAERFHRAYRQLLEDRGIGSLSSVAGTEVRVAYGADRKVMDRFVR